MKLRVEFTFDEESKNWCFRVPSLHILGGSKTRELAEHEVTEAIQLALEGAPSDIDADADEVAFFDVQVTPARTETPVAR